MVILGVGSGLGRSVAWQFGREGYQLALVARRQEPLAQLAEELAADGIVAEPFAADVADLAGLPDLFARITARFGAIDVLYNGVIPPGGFVPATDLTVDTLRDQIEVVTYPVIAAIRLVLPDMVARGEGAILWANGASALHADPGMSGPGPALAATRNYLQTLHAEFAPKGVYVGELLVAAMIEGSLPFETMAEAGLDLTALPVVRPDDLAALLSQLNRERSSFEIVHPAWG